VAAAELRDRRVVRRDVAGHNAAADGPGASRSP
jgi:hypothetical protein